MAGGPPFPHVVRQRTTQTRSFVAINRDLVSCGAKMQRSRLRAAIAPRSIAALIFEGSQDCPCKPHWIVLMARQVSGAERAAVFQVTVFPFRASRLPALS